MTSVVKVSLIVLSFATLLASTSVFATDITVGGTTVMVDDRESSGDSDASGYDSIYNIDQMNVSWSSDETITVDIFTNFANLNNGVTNNNRYNEGSKNIVYGDLLMGLRDSSGANSYYAFKLGGDRYSKGHVNSSTSTGGLYAINGVYTSGQYHGTDKTGRVFGRATNNIKLGTNTSWGTSQSTRTNEWGVSQGKVSFSFNVAGLDMFQNATSLGLSWAMSCFNDSVGGTYAVQRSVPVVGVPEPTSVVLMLIALGGLVYRRRNKSESFTA